MRELKIKNISWISIVKPSKDDLAELESRFPDIHPLVLEDLTTPTIRSRVENYDTYLYMVLHFPRFIEHEHRTITHEMDFILMQNTVITAQYDDIQKLDEFWHECESEDPKTQSQYGKNPISLIYYLIRRFFNASLLELDSIQEKIDTLEEDVFSGKEKNLLEEIAKLKRNVLDFRRAAKPQQLTFESLIPQGIELYGIKVKPFLIDLRGEYLRVWNLLENHKETVDALYETNNSLLATRTNNTVLAFTVIAFISFIPTAIANIYGMNLKRLPLAEGDNAFWMISGLMVGITLFIYLILKWRKLV